MRKDRTRTLTDAQWALVAPLIPKLAHHNRPPINRREVLNGILHVLRTGIPWKEMSKKYPSAETCHRQYLEWVCYGVMQAVLDCLAEDLRTRGQFDTRQMAEAMCREPAGSRAFVQGERAGWARGQKCWRYQTAELLLSVSLRKILRRAK